MLRRFGSSVCIFSKMYLSVDVVMDETNIQSGEDMPVINPVAVPVPEAPKTTATISSVAPSEMSAVDSNQNEVAVEDIWTNGKYTFRVDQVTSAGSVHIRFRTDANLDAKPFSPNKILAFLMRKETAPDGDWFFGSVEEFRNFAAEGGYRLEKRSKTEK